MARPAFNLKGFFKSSPIHPLQMGLFILIELLLIFGKEFSKFHLFWQFHLYDFLFIILSITGGIIFLIRKKKFLNWPILFLLAISAIYLGYSYFGELGPLKYIIRHYALFVYLGGFYLIFAGYIDAEKNLINIRFLVLMGMAAFAIQIGYHLYNFIFTQDYFSGLFKDFNYHSLLIFPGLFVFQAYILIYMQKEWMKWSLIVMLGFLSFTMGHHSSAVLCFVVLLFLNFILKWPGWVKAVGIVLLLVSIVPLFKAIPQFQDHNSLWRLIYWRETLHDIVVDYYAVLGHGFGGRFTTLELLEILKTEINSPWMELKPEEQYLSPMHNSFITIAYHIGLLPSLLLLVPLKRHAVYFFKRGKENLDLKSDFLLLSLIGLMLWTSFHVVLELPHSSAFFWLVYFASVYHFQRETAPEAATTAIAEAEVVEAAATKN